MKKILAILVIVLAACSLAQAGSWWLDDIVLETSTLHAPQQKNAPQKDWQWADLKAKNGLRWGFYPDSNLYEGSILTVAFDSEFYFEQKFFDLADYSWLNLDSTGTPGNTNDPNTGENLRAKFLNGNLLPLNIQFQVMGKFAPKFTVANIWTAKPYIYFEWNPNLNEGLGYIVSALQWENNIDVVRGYLSIRPDFFLWMGMPKTGVSDISPQIKLTVCSPDWNEWMPERGRIQDTFTKYAVRQNAKFSFQPSRYKDLNPEVGQKTVLEYMEFNTFIRVQQEVLNFAGVDTQNIELEVFAEQKIDIFKGYDYNVAERNTAMFTWGQYGLAFKAYGFYTGLYFIFDTQDFFNSNKVVPANATMDGGNWAGQSWIWENGERGKDYWDFIVNAGNSDLTFGRGRAGVQLELGYENGEVKFWTKYQGRHRIRLYDNPNVIADDGFKLISDMWRNDFEFGVRFKW